MAVPSLVGGGSQEDAQGSAPGVPSGQGVAKDRGRHLSLPRMWALRARGRAAGSRMHRTQNLSETHMSARD